MGKRVRDHMPLRFSLDIVIANRGGRVQAFLNVTGFKDFLRALRQARPHTGKTVGLKLHAHL